MYEISTLDYHATRVDRAVADYQQDVARLHLPDGKKKYADAVYTERQTAALGRLQDVVETAQEVARAAQEQAERDEQAASSDPSAWLTPEELTTANSRALFIAEDAKRLSLPDLAKRGEQVLASKDRVSIFLHARYLGQRIDAVMEEETKRARAGGVLSQQGSSAPVEGLSELSQVVHKLNAAATPERVKQRAASAKELQKRAQDLHYDATLKLQEADGSLERARAEFARNVRYNM